MIDIFKTAIFADLHTNAISPREFYNLFMKVAVPKLEEKRPHMIVLAGDTMHKKASFNSEASIYVIKLIRELMKLCDYLRIVVGTKSHDYSQMDNFKYLEDEEGGCDVRIISHVCVEQIEKYKILYVPEEYMTDPDDFYKKFFSQKVDQCFGHGTFSFAGYVSNLIESETPIKEAPTFNHKQFKNVAGAVYFGHIHESISSKDKIFYPGSFTRWHHGEEKPKGWYFNEYNIKEKTFKHEFIENELAPYYITKTFDKLFLNEDKKTDLKIKQILKKKESLNAYKLKIKVKKKEILTNEHFLIIKEFFSNNPKLGVTIEVLNKQEVQIINEEEEQEDSEYSFVTDPDLSTEDIIIQFVEKKHNVSFTKEELSELAYVE